MSNLFDIGKSGLQSYQRALAVTGQNIANINTDGYKRREIRLEEVSAQQGGITEAPQKTGLGVRMDDIRRSFNEFLLNKARSATAYAATTEVLVNSLSHVENILLPGETGLNMAMTDFFNSMHEVAAAPADRAARTLFIQAGERMAESFRQTSSMITLEQNGITQQIDDGLKVVNTLTAELAGLNQMIASSGSTSSNNALLDTRDAIIDKISNYIEVSVNLEENRTASITLGNSGQGPMLVEGSDRATIGVKKGDLKLSFLLAIGLSETPTSRVTNGSIRGYSDAYSMLSEIRNQLDNLAFHIANTMNAAHREGLDLNGERGGVLFHDITVGVNPHANNRGDTIAELTISDAGLLPTDDITVTYDEKAQVWNAVNSKNTVLATGRQAIELPGMRIDLNGALKMAISLSSNQNRGRQKASALRSPTPTGSLPPPVSWSMPARRTKVTPSLMSGCSRLILSAASALFRMFFQTVPVPSAQQVFCVMRQWLLSRKMFRRSSCFRWHASRS